MATTKAVKPAKTTKAPAAKTVKKTVAPEVEKDATKSVQASVLGVDGKAAGKMALPAEYFGAEMNRQLIAQSIRVYLANQRAGQASTKTRGEVEGSTRKIYRQKGTGKARHGGIRAPIFVGGGIVFGPKPRDYTLKFPPKMAHAALACALSHQLSRNNIIFVSGFAEMEPKTKPMAAALSAVGAKGRTLFVVGPKANNVMQAARNIRNVDMMSINDIYAYTVMTHGKIVFMKEAVAALKK